MGEGDRNLLGRNLLIDALADLPVPMKQTRDDMERELIINSLLSLNNDVKEILRLLKGERQTVSSRWGRFVEVEEALFEEPKNLGRIGLPCRSTRYSGRSYAVTR